MSYTNPYGTESPSKQISQPVGKNIPDQRQPQSWLVAAITVVSISVVIITCCLMVLLGLGVLLEGILF